MVDGEELLALPAPLAEFLAAARTGGIPLLYPYANRLRAAQFVAAGRAVDLAQYASLKRDGAGLPIHGLLLRWSAWECVNNGASFEAALDWRAHRTLMDAYPFPHTLRVHFALGGEQGAATLAITTTVEANGGVDVPWAFGWHPYFALTPNAQLELPTRRPIALDASGLPQRTDAASTSASSSPSPLHAPSTTAACLGQDDLYSTDACAHACINTGTRRIEIEFDSEYRFMQVYSPKNMAFASIEPMVAPTSALADGRTTTVAASTTRSARFVMRACMIKT